MNNCANCEHCKVIKYKKRLGFFCKHPEQLYIHEYFEKHRVSYAAGFLGYSKTDTRELLRKRIPKWCPEKKEVE